MLESSDKSLFILKWVEWKNFLLFSLFKDLVIFSYILIDISEEKFLMRKKRIIKNQ